MDGMSVTRRRDGGRETGDGRRETASLDSCMSCMCCGIRLKSLGCRITRLLWRMRGLRLEAEGIPACPGRETVAGRAGPGGPGRGPGTDQPKTLPL